MGEVVTPGPDEVNPFIASLDGSSGIVAGSAGVASALSCYSIGVVRCRLAVPALLSLAACTGAGAPPIHAVDAAPPGPRIDAGTAPGFDAGVADDAGPIDAGPAALLDAGAPPPERGWEAASIYLMMVDRFADGAPNATDDECTRPDHPNYFHGGDLVGLRERLGYLQELGIDTVWVTPLPRQIGRRGDSCGYHGYWAALEVPDDGAIEPRLGTDEDLTALIDAMHARGMRLILDLVVNHPGYDAPVTRSHPEWFHPVDGCERLGDPVQTCPLARLPDFDQSVPQAADYITGATVGWLERFDVDGVRMDTVKHVPLSFFRDTWIPAAREGRPDLYLVGEVFDSSPYDSQRRYLDAGFDGLFDFRLRDALVWGLAKGGGLDEVAQRVGEAWRALGTERALLRSLFIENHDVPRYASEITAPSDEVATARLHLAIAVITTTGGVPQLYMGTELGMSGSWPDNRRDFPDWGWDESTRTPHDGYQGDPGQTFALTRDLLALRTERAALRAGDYTELWRPGGSGVPLFAFARTAGDDRVFVTLTTGAVALRVPLEGNPHFEGAPPDGAELVDLLGRADGARATVVDGQLEVELPAHSVAVWAAP